MNLVNRIKSFVGMEHRADGQVTFAEQNEPSLLGMVTLEDVLLAVDPVGQRLVPVEAERL